MVITRAHSKTNVQARNTNMNDYSDNESDISLHELNSHNLIAETVVITLISKKGILNRPALNACSMERINKLVN